jgi:NADPH:quinone reductase-like Zn-dependent oxidoreductase
MVSCMAAITVATDGDAIMTLNGKRIVVLGGSSGIGLATAQAAAREGASVGAP